MKLNDVHVNILSVLIRAGGESYLHDIESKVVSRMKFASEDKKTLAIIDIRYGVPELSAENLITITREGVQLVGAVNCARGDLLEITDKGTATLRDELENRVGML